jgi:tetratricopeptide (TPR) repeat protein
MWRDTDQDTSEGVAVPDVAGLPEDWNRASLFAQATLARWKPDSEAGIMARFTLSLARAILELADEHAAFLIRWAADEPPHDYDNPDDGPDVQALRRAMQLAPDNHQAYIELAVIYEAVGEYERAEQTIQEALELSLGEHERSELMSVLNSLRERDKAG